MSEIYGDKSTNLFVRFLMFFVNIVVSTIRGLLKMILTMVLLYAAIYFGGMLYLDANPEKKQWVEKKRSGVINLLVRFNKVLEAQGKSNFSQDENGDGLKQFSGMISPEIIQTIINSMGGDVKNTAPLIDKDVALVPDSIPPQLAPIDNLLQGHEDYFKIKPKLIVANVGRNGAGAISLLNKLMKSKNKRVVKAAYKSLVLIGTYEAMEVLRKHGY